MTSQTRKVTIKSGKTASHFVVHKVDDWQNVAKALVRLVKPGTIVALSGPLGAGKTTLVQYLAKTLDAPKRAISPTFALMRIYKLETRISKLVSRNRKTEIRDSAKRKFDIRRLVHVDAYRIEDVKDLVVLDLDEELMEPGTVVLIEWPENIRSWLSKKHPIEVRISF
ncbi:MAG: tRNA (adenosine(37)-N6)-threonylcarbamoyltransferase complex ATPase subunit type 1 TsaE [Patescibacteria group bacterium]|nr:tRNA (adenosine(37)-N6)-threonylcarbamoyltransferase complex ATPase subunit type 1 TsaE [Patescibacteria group bacterium]